jgi:hypothetical protein
MMVRDEINVKMMGVSGMMSNSSRGVTAVDEPGKTDHGSLVMSS